MKNPIYLTILALVSVIFITLPIVFVPISGRLVNFSGVQKGNFIVQGQPIGEISPEENMVAECMVSPKDIGFIKKNQKVKFQIDAYNYNQ